MRIEEQAMGDEAAWRQFAEQTAEEFLDAERGALLRVANGLGNKSDAVFLARSRGRNDVADELSRPKTPVYACVYCGREVNDGCPDPSMFSCCGEVGHVERVDEPMDYEAEDEPI